ncbi:MAG: hypothetical protein IPM24_22040 [Bryobacterales bacterium]|nr:hypothetical protein [Bryobacterales bacterium]
MYIRILPILMVVSAMAVTPLTAGSIGPSNCGSCFGNEYVLDHFGQTDQTGDTETHSFRLTINMISPASSVLGQYVGAVAVKVTTSVISAQLLDAPLPGTWDLKGAVLNSPVPRDCGQPSSGSGWVCFDSTVPNGAEVVQGASYSWAFLVTMAKDTLLGTASIQADYDPARGRITSEALTVPEGDSIEIPFLLGGLVGLWVVTRRRAVAVR